MEQFLTAPDMAYTIESIIKITASVICGFILGLERKTHNQAVGTRTLVLICVSSALLSLLSVFMAERFSVAGDPTRIVAGVVSGIGFLGGGAILRQGLNIKGLTSAAIIWTASALGLAIGAGMYIQSLFVLITVEVLLLLLERLEEKLFPAVRTKMLHLVYNSATVDMKRLGECLGAAGLKISDVNISRVFSHNQIILHYAVKVPRESGFTELLEQLAALGPLAEFSVTD